MIAKLSSFSFEIYLFVTDSSFSVYLFTGNATCPPSESPKKY